MASTRPRRNVQQTSYKELLDSDSESSDYSSGSDLTEDTPVPDEVRSLK